MMLLVTTAGAMVLGSDSSATPPPSWSATLSAIRLRSMWCPAGHAAVPGNDTTPPPVPIEKARFGSPATFPAMMLLARVGAENALSQTPPPYPKVTPPLVPAGGTARLPLMVLFEMMGVPTATYTPAPRMSALLGDGPASTLLVMTLLMMVGELKT
jgi:hypothetical protein